MKFVNKYLLLVALIVITLLLLFVHNKGFYKVLNIPLDNNERILGLSDASVGGDSMMKVSTNAEGTSFNCNIVNKFQWPFCQLQIYMIPFNEQDKNSLQHGFDISEYDELFVDIKYQGPKPELLRLHIRNYNPAYTNLEVDSNSMKINEFKIEANAYKTKQFINLKDFYVVPWWGSERNLPTELKLREFSNVPLIEVLTTDHVQEGELTVNINEISFRRLYISNENLLFTIIAMWLAAAAGYLILQLHNYRSNLKQARLSNNRLIEIMDALKLEKAQIEEMSKRDTLTGLRNRSGLSLHFTQCATDLLEQNTPFSIVFIDIDFFKNINDLYGHNRGDDILVTFAQIIHSNIRIADKLGRWGGEEFILICTNSTLNQANSIAEKLCRIIQQHLFGSDLQVTASFGVAEMYPDESVKDFIERADKALYKAKAEGRNQVQVSV
ncbi:GGDEF domain-containing protein [Psychromonas marina]|uniref:diguanylate cyclase n=1 Tax=Psychromonas marina TaxID=88364 RepID=A0ABQ6E3G3_9GAMM|nr:GGDEF domain-containing protein [Psychromonas marina]GLS91949.1 GGDEF domain-containing protein [Psychromonas marina]